MSRLSRILALNIDLGSIYGDNFPIITRHHLADWLESHVLNCDPLEFLKSMVEEIQEAETRLPPTVQVEERLNLLRSAAIIKKKYKTNPAMLQQVLGEIFRQEEELILRKAGQMVVEIQIPRDPLVSEFEVNVININKQLNVIDEQNGKCSKILDQINSTFNDMIKNVSTKWDIEGYIYQCRKNQPTFDCLTPDAMMDIQRECDLLEQEIQQKEFNIQHFISILESEATELYKQLTSVRENLIVKCLESWKYEKRQGLNELFLKEKLNKIKDWLQKIAKSLDSLLKLTLRIGDIKNIYFEKLGRNSIARVDGFELLYVQITEELRLLLKKGFIVEKQPWLVHKTTTQNLEEMKVRHLFLDQHQIQNTCKEFICKVDLIDEATAKDLWEGNIEVNAVRFAFGQVSESTAVMTPDPLNGNFTAAFPELKLKSVATRTKPVYEYKYAYLCHADVQAFGMSVKIWTMTEPIIVISHTNYIALAWGRVIWEQEFAQNNRIPFTVPDSVNSAQFRRLLNREFKRMTGQDLPDGQLTYLWEKIHWMQSGRQGAGEFVTMAEFCKDNHRSRDQIFPFTFWTWFHAATKLIAENFAKEFKNELIYGFIGREQAENLLLSNTYENGTFLGRFSEFEVGALSITYKKSDEFCETITFTSEDLSTKPLNQKLYDLSCLTKIYPAKDKSLIGGPCASKPTPEAPARFGYKKVAEVTTIVSTPDVFMDFMLQ